jgi:hypothetical protein
MYVHADWICSYMDVICIAIAIDDDDYYVVIMLVCVDHNNIHLT